MWSKEWIELSQDRDRWRTLVTAVMNLRVSYNAGNFLTNWKPVSFSRRTLLHGIWRRKHLWRIIWTLIELTKLYILTYHRHLY